MTPNDRELDAASTVAVLDTPRDVERAVARRQVLEMVESLDEDTRDLLRLKGMID